MPGTSPESIPTRAPADEDVIRLIRLKRHESPGDEYFEQLLPRFHERQRREILQASSRGLFFERLGVFFDSVSGGRWLAGGVAAYAALILFGLVFLQTRPMPGNGAPLIEPVSAIPTTPENRIRVEASLQNIQPLDAPPAAPAAPVGQGN